MFLYPNSKVLKSILFYYIRSMCQIIVRTLQKFEENKRLVKSSLNYYIAYYFQNISFLFSEINWSTTNCKTP